MSSPPLTVLVVDDEDDDEDDDDQARLICTPLERAGCRTVRVGSAERALARPVSPAPDLVVVDLVVVDLVVVDLVVVDFVVVDLLPGVDGWGPTHALHERRPGTAVAVCSVLDRQDHPAGHPALPEPFTGDDVRALLDQVTHRPAPGLRARAVTS